MQPFFSIITPVYNCEKFLRKCVESVIGQTYTSWELILVDDGSTDSSGEICDNFCYDPRIKVIHQNNAGQLTSRINGIKVARGIYELGLDADDYLDRKCLETIKQAIDTSGSDIILYGYRKFGCQTGVVRSSLEAGKEYSQKEFLKEIIRETNHALWNKAIRLEKVKRADYSGLTKRLDINEDYVQMISILCEVDSAYVIDDILYHYRVNRKSISHLYTIKHIWDTIYASEYVVHKLKKSSLMDNEMYDMINLAYLKMTEQRLYCLFCDNSITRKDCKNIHKSQIYQKSKKMETIGCFTKNDLLILKLFRYRQYGLLKLVAKLRKL